ncbi:MAG: VWA domain-containing protein, partial [Candidatus Dadabacteria bacterium]
VRDELHALVDRLEASRLDFRLALIEAESCITIHCNGVFPFHGPMETEELRGAVDRLHMEGSDVSPTATYDALLWSATDLLWRDGADVTRLVVVVTNDMPQSVYGNVWNLDSHGTAANREAARLALEEAGLTLYYAQPTGPEGFRYLEDYADAERNPRAACSRGEGGWDCGFEGLGERLSWPFDQAEIPLPEPGPVADSRYYFAWLSPFGPVTDPGETRVVEIRTADPDDPTRDIALTFEYGFPGEEGALRLVLTDEAGDPLPASLDECVSVYRTMGDRAVELTEVCPGDGGEPGVAVADLLMPGPVALEMGYDFATNPGAHNSYYSDLGYQGARFDVEVPAGETLDVPWQVEVKDRRADLWRIRGLLKDLREWGLGSRPFASAADRIAAWVEGFETGPMTLEDKDRLIRLTHALGGYLYLSGYAETQARKVENGLIDVIRRLRAIIQKLRDTADEADTVGWLTDAEAAARLAASLGTDLEAAEAIGEAEALRALARALLEYAEEELVPEVIAKILDQIPLGPAGPYVNQFLVGVVLDDWDSAGSLWDTVGELTLDGVLDAAVAAAPDLLRAAGDEVLSGLPDEATDAYDLLFDLIEALARDGTDGLTEAVRSTAQDLLARYASPEAALARVRDAVSVLTETLSPGPVRDALVPVLDLMLRVALEEGDFDNDAAIGVLAT